MGNSRLRQRVQHDFYAAAIAFFSPPRPSNPCAARPPRPGLPTLRPRSGQPCALSILGGLHACATARRTRVRLRVASRANRRQSATVCPASDPDRGRVWPPWSSSAARPSPFFGRVVPQPRVFALLPAPRARHIPRYVVGEAPPPRLAGVPHSRRRTVGLKSASAGLRTLETASPAAKARFSSLPLCGEALPRLSAEGNRRGAGRAI